MAKPIFYCQRLNANAFWIVLVACCPEIGAQALRRRFGANSVKTKSVGDTKGSAMEFTHTQFTLSEQQANRYKIDCRDYVTVSSLPENTPLVAVAGVWGRFVNIRCLFRDPDGGRFLRNIRKQEDGYVIRELNIDAKAIEVGQIFSINI